MRGLTLATAVSSLTLFVVGCGSGGPGERNVTAEGRVALGGETFSGASIHFVLRRTGADFGVDLQPDGTYSVPLFKVRTGDAFDVYFGPVLAERTDGAVDAAGTPLPNPPPPLPRALLDHSTSKLEATIGEDSKQTFDFDLPKK